MHIRTLTLSLVVISLLAACSQEERVDISQAELDLARKGLTDSEIYAPFDGVIASLSVENYQSVRAKSPIARRWVWIQRCNECGRRTGLRNSGGCIVR